MKYWRTILCASALGVGGLAVWADDCVRGDGLLRRGKTEKSEVATVAAVEPAPPAESEPPVKVIMDIGTPSLPVAPPVVPPPIIPPLTDPQVKKAAASKPETPEPPGAAKLDEPPPLPAGKLELPPDPLVPPAPKAPSGPKISLPPELPKEVAPPAPPLREAVKTPELGSPTFKPVVDLPKAGPAESPRPEVVPPAAPKTPAVSLPPAPEPPAAAAPSNAPVAGPFKMFLRMGGTAQPRFEVKDGDALILKVYFDHVDLKGSHDGLTASGHVRLHGSGLDGTCDQLLLSSTKGEVELKGNVKLNCYRGGASSLLMAEQLKFQLKGATEPVKPRGNSVVPATWSGSR